METFLKSIGPKVPVLIIAKLPLTLELLELKFKGKFLFELLLSLGKRGDKRYDKKVKLCERCKI